MLPGFWWQQCSAEFLGPGLLRKADRTLGLLFLGFSMSFQGFLMSLKRFLMSFQGFLMSLKRSLMSFKGFLMSFTRFLMNLKTGF